MALLGCANSFILNSQALSNLSIIWLKVNFSSSVNTSFSWILKFAELKTNFLAIKCSFIVSGDGDFHCLVEYLVEKDKLLKVLTPTKHYSSLLRKFNNQHYIVRIDLLRGSLEQKKTGIRGRSKP